MRLITEPYLTQAQRWPPTGRHVLVQFEDSAVVVYQAYRPSIGRFAATHGYFGGEFSFSRMSWIKPNFLWMMYRSAWGTREGQTITLAIWLRRAAFDAILAQAIPSAFAPHDYASHEEWQAAVARSSVRVQWDPYHDPSGVPLQRRAIQLGLRDDALAHYARDWIVEIEDISSFVSEQREIEESKDYARLNTPREDVYPLADRRVAAALGIAAPGPDLAT